MKSYSCLDMCQPHSRWRGNNSLAIMYKVYMTAPSKSMIHCRWIRVRSPTSLINLQEGLTRWDIPQTAERTSFDFAFVCLTPPGGIQLHSPYLLSPAVEGSISIDHIRLQVAIVTYPGPSNHSTHLSYSV